MTQKRMSKEARRQQLLETALSMIAEEGTGTLTLSRVAERAGITKPIAYEHFGTREGLLIALFRQFDDRAEAAFNAALAQGGHSLETIANIVSECFIGCFVSAGPAGGALLDALSANDETAEFLRNWRMTLVQAFGDAFQPYVVCPRKRLNTSMIGLLGAAESLALAAADRHLTKADAVKSLTEIMTGTLGAFAARQA